MYIHSGSSGSSIFVSANSPGSSCVMVGMRLLGLGGADGVLVGATIISAAATVLTGLRRMGGASTGTLCCFASSIADDTVVWVVVCSLSLSSVTVFTFDVKMSSNAVICALLGRVNVGGILPLSVSTNSLAACTIVSAEVSDGIVMYLCLKYIVSDP